MKKDLSYFNSALQKITVEFARTAQLVNDPIALMEAHLKLRAIFQDVYEDGFTTGFDCGNKNIEDELKKEAK